ncbi:MAG TPA: hypothetical protein VE641_12525, partial [Chthoniobacterales bacterium]|nr:hypothetical protein [Chthoniobacterales bacterium]
MRALQLRLIASVLLGLILASQANASPEKPDPGSDIIAKYVDTTRARQENLRGVEMEVEIRADLPKLKKSGKMNALRMISGIGKISYKMLG